MDRTIQLETFRQKTILFDCLVTYCKSLKIPYTYRDSTLTITEHNIKLSDKLNTQTGEYELSLYKGRMKIDMGTTNTPMDYFHYIQGYHN